MALGDATGIRYSNSILSVMLFILLLMLGRIVCPIFAKVDKVWKIKAYIFSTLISTALHIGAEYEFYDGVDFAKPSLYINTICLAVAMAPFVAYLWRKPRGLNVIERDENEMDKATGKTSEPKSFRSSTLFNFFYIWAIIFLFWMPVFFALYPGAFVYDATEEYVEVISRQFTMHHPLLHVLALGGIVHLFEYIGAGANLGIAVYVLLQMLVMSAALSFVVRSLQMWGVTKRYAFITVLFFSIFPLFPLYAVCTAKDGLFTVFLLVSIVSMGNIIRSTDAEKEPVSTTSMSDMVIFLVSSTLMMMLRNNGLYAYTATALIIVIVFIVDRRHRSASSNRITARLLILMALSIVLLLGSTRILKLATGATDGEHQEMLTVPIQQLARTYTYSPEAFTPDEEALLKAFIPEDYLTTYSPRISDVLKSGFDNQYYESHRALFYKLWLTIGARRPITYLNAHLGTSYGYVYPDALNNVYKGNTMNTFTYTDSSYFGFETEPPGTRESMLPALEFLIEKLSLDLFQQKCPVLSMLFAPGFVFWVFFFVLVGYVDRKNLPMMLLVLMTFATVLLGPTTLVRYVLILWYITPLYPIWIKEAERK
ncbi:DUF6020 family protein [Lacrimispora saccharolytica]|uniref:DUF6020 family protein n=1 Tax=Lacrimispora saccharolytica TaxID=84030 RepID=UPI00265CA4C9|nr:DUF6020 family protein [Lacrimispora saccharolytica]MCF2657177.1 hypothetical protein [Lacrimispora saccharolytica]